MAPSPFPERLVWFDARWRRGLLIIHSMMLAAVRRAAKLACCGFARFSGV
jgi:hypothetical protein